MTTTGIYYLPVCKPYTIGWSTGNQCIWSGILGHVGELHESSWAELWSYASRSQWLHQTYPSSHVIYLTSVHSSPLPFSPLPAHILSHHGHKCWVSHWPPSFRKNGDLHAPPISPSHPWSRIPLPSNPIGHSISWLNQNEPDGLHTCEGLSNPQYVLPLCFIIHNI